MWRLAPSIALLPLAIPAAGLAQQPLPATTVQLPTIRQFSVQTTVSVPDGGTLALGSLGGGYNGSARRGIGLLGSRGIASGRTTGSVSVSSRIVDHSEMDRAILATAAAKAKTGPDADAVPAEALLHAAPANRGRPSSVAAIRQENDSMAERELAELKALFSKGQAAETAGKNGVAKVYYQMVARRDRGNLQRLASERLAALQVK